MHVSTMVRRSIAVLAVLITASACSDATNAPRAVQRPAFDISALQPEASRTGNGKGQGAKLDTTEKVTTLTIDPNTSGVYAFGENWIYFPAHSICDPATSGYASTLWDAPCTTLTVPVQVTVHWSSKGGYAYARFSPELRFVPADAQSYTQWVWLYLHGQKRIHELSAYSILYCSDTDGWIDESLTDPTLRARIDSKNNSVFRRVKHFSGYMVAAAYSDLGGMSDASY